MLDWTVAERQSAFRKRMIGVDEVGFSVRLGQGVGNTGLLKPELTREELGREFDQATAEIDMVAGRT